MSEIRNTKTFMRVVHRYLGYFMAGIMAVYAISGIVLVYRDTDLLKKEKVVNKTIAPNLNKGQLSKALHIKGVRINKTENGVVYFNKTGTYNRASGEVNYTTKELPYILEKMTHLHKAKSGNAMSPLNVLFGVSLFFFVISSFWMFNAKSKIFKRGLYFTVGGLVLALVLLFI
ncbi:hypothetical protein NBRC110019_28110 [Neptunitalea chrysea]|uniref:PepSY-associated TM region n=1 Tax=Neptunitalea chrysea TaxID=1647581 RepID=A0A9W6B734_9FLAO|nr:hypothetical protein [Neptunitalea chrysea]GLB53770.1 hypothetical protein NBRC110019_28110 [Neptunitalea chrysea]